ncbi:MAG: xanthine phosphoribosyltransferase [Clostridia bacterium]|nr:xanthine phosphoribosyltransferase [Clostridia bacterium]
MQLLQDRIRQEGKIAPGNVLRVDSFINHQMDVELLTQLAEEFHRRFANERVDKVLTVEASGIAAACLVAQAFRVPLVFAKKSKTANIPDTVYSSTVKSYTHGNVNDIIVSKEFLHPGERVLLIDDFLAHGEALRGLIDVVQQAGGTVVGAGILVEKAFQDGGRDLRAQGYRIESLARVASMSVEDGVVFADDEA